MPAPQNGLAIRVLGKVLRAVGQGVDKAGQTIMGKEGYVEGLVPSTRVVSLKGKQFTYGVQNFVASSASVVGSVAFGEMTSLWHGATVRGDKNPVTVGRNTAILDNAVVSAAAGAVKIGDDVVVQPGAVVNGAAIGDGSMIGMGAIVQPGAQIGNDCFIDAGAVVPSKSVVPPGTLWTGNPAKQLRTLAPEEMKYLRSMAVEYGALSQRYFDQAAKSPAEVEEDKYWDDYRRIKGMAPMDPIPTADPDVLKYYELTAPAPDSGVFRSKEFNKQAERALRAADEIAADAEEDARCARAILNRRVMSTLKTLVSVRRDRHQLREAAIADLRALDINAADAVDYIASLAASLSEGEPQGKEKLIAEISDMDPSDYYADPAEKAAAAAEIFDVLVVHCRAKQLAGGAGSLGGSLPSSAAASPSARV